MRVESIATSAYRVPLASPWEDQTHRVSHIELVLSEIKADTGQTGAGFSYTVGVGGRAIQAMIDWYIAPRLIGTVVAPRLRWQEMWSAVHDAGGGGISTMALAALDIALWDLAAKERNQPLVELLGQFRQSIPAYASGINLNLDEKQLEEQVRHQIDAGYDAVKIKVGKPDLGEDLDRLAMVRRAIGNRRLLMVDANQGWNVSSAVRAIRGYEPFDLYWVEEPLLSDDVQGHARLRGLVRTPIAIGENVYSSYQFNEYLTRGACDFVQADVVRIGGITPWLEIAALARTWDVPIAPHFLVEISGQLLCCIPNGVIVEDVAGGSFRELGILAEDLGVTEGRFTPPNRPGHGIVLDSDKLRPHLLRDDPSTTADLQSNIS